MWWESRMRWEMVLCSKFFRPYYHSISMHNVFPAPSGEYRWANPDTAGEQNWNGNQVGGILGLVYIWIFENISCNYSLWISVSASHCGSCLKFVFHLEKFTLLLRVVYSIAYRNGVLHFIQITSLIMDNHQTFLSNFQTSLIKHKTQIVDLC